MKIEIMIPYSPQHMKLAMELHTTLMRQVHDCGAYASVAVTTMPDLFANRGKIRNKCLELLNAEYGCFFDADDIPSRDYISKLIDGIKGSPDCCSLTGVMTTDGDNPEIFEHSIIYPDYKTNPATAYIRYERYPNHLNLIKSGISKQFKFPEIDFGEDTDWATQIKESGLLKHENTISGVIYHYQYQSKK